MTEPTEDEITRALTKAAETRDSATKGIQWSFGAGVWYDEPTARMHVRSCLILGVPVSTTLTVNAWAALVDRVLLLERAMDVNRPSA